MYKIEKSTYVQKINASEANRYRTHYDQENQISSDGWYINLNLKDKLHLRSSIITKHSLRN